MIAQFARAPHQAKPAGPPITAPHAALLIDFDNVTMGIRSDITKELKNLLNSDIIKGKVAVQRAYADWRRYPQYVVPLAEASVDLIFAPAYGSSKKNATDIRLSIDALELVFTRPEIGTFILLSGDSDFSSLVLKLKEYGKYVVGVGIRESASDLLVQNCDEYYSYSALTGLTRAGEDGQAPTADPWELVEVAVAQMVANNDVMRSDRLKQVLLDLDANFDEKTMGFSKFNRFVAEAANRGVINLHKLENGQFEIALAGSPGDGPAPRSEREPRPERGRRGRRGRDMDVEAPVERAERAERAAPPVAEAAREAPAEPRRQTAAASERAAKAEGGADELRAAYDLLRRATTDLGAVGERAVRDSDVKRRMRDLEPEWDESQLGFSKFSRFLRQAHDAEVINLRKVDNGNYEVAAAGSAPGGIMEETEEQPVAAEARDDGRRRERGRRGERRERGGARREHDERAPAMESAREAPAPAQVPAMPAAVTPAAPVTPPQTAPSTASPAVAAAASPAVAGPAAAAATPAARPAAAPPPSIGARRGSRGRRPDETPPLLAGQVIPVRQETPARPVPPPAATAPSAAASPTAPTPGPRPTTAAPPDREAVITRLSSYHGIGRKTAESLVDALGADRVFATLHGAPERVREILGAKRGDLLIEGWRAESAARAVAVEATLPPGANALTDDEPFVNGEGAERGPGRGRRGGRRRGGRGRKRAPANSA